MSLPKSIVERIEKIEKKYGAIGQDMESYLDGLLYSDSLTYWDYIHLDTLLSIQNTRTDLHDEKIFLTYHQITELYFSLILHELQVLCSNMTTDRDIWLSKINRVNRYYKALIESFEITIDGIDKDEFLKFRMSLLPASGFQSAQYRKIEIHCTSLHRLVKAQHRDAVSSSDLKMCFEKLYWKSGNLSAKTGEKTLTLKHFEARYDAELYELAQRLEKKHILAQMQTWPVSLKTDKALSEALATLDRYANQVWPQLHMKAAVRHLQKKSAALEATGGTNWQDYLPPKKQAIEYF